MPRVYVFDLDGVLYRGSEPVEYAAETIARLRARQPAPQLFFLTNNSMLPRQSYADKLTQMGMPCREEEIVTSASATADYLTGTLKAQGRSALVVGGQGLADTLSQAGLRVCRASDEPNKDDDDDPPEFVVVGRDVAFTFKTINRAMQAILRGAVFIATNRDGQFPVEGGRISPGSGAMVAAIEAATDKTAQVIGKPEPLGLQTILRHAQATPDEAVMIGDRLDTDILCGNRVGVPTVLVLTGITNETTARHAPEDSRPGRIISDLRELE